MSNGVTVTGDVAGGAIVGSATTFTLNGLPVAVVGDPVASHGDSPHAAATLAEGSGWMTWDGVPVVVEGCAATCGHTATGQAWFRIPK